MIEVSNSQWHVKAFLFLHELFWKGFMNDRWYEPPRHTNVCTYIRSFIFLPLLLLVFGIGPWFLLLGSMFVLPIYMVGITAIGIGLWNVLIWTVAGVIGVALWFLLGYMIAKLQKKLSLYVKNKEMEILEESKKTSLWSLTKTFFKDRHDKLCSIIEIKS